MPVETLRWRDGRLTIIDQTLLPVTFKEITLDTLEEVWEAIKALRVRGAPAIGVCAAFGVLVGIKQKKPADAPVPGKNSESVLKKDAGDSEKKIEKNTEKKPEHKLQSGIKDKPSKERALSVAKPKKQEVKSALKTPSVKAVKRNTRKSYVLQVGAFQDPKKAERLRKDLNAKGYAVSITTVSPGPGRTFSRVRLGPYTTKEEAEEIHSTLKGRGLEGIVVPGPQ